MRGRRVVLCDGRFHAQNSRRKRVIIEEPMREKAD
jgi:hypothetical protein